MFGKKKTKKIFTHSDASVVNAFLDCNESILSEWYDHCWEEVLRMTSKWLGITKSDREDIFQTAVTLLWTKISDRCVFCVGTTVYARSRKGTHAVESLKGYFLRIVKNCYFELVRNESRITFLSDSELQVPDDSDFMYDSDIETTKDIIVGECLARLSTSCLEILVLFYHTGMTLEEILKARDGNTSYNGLKTRKSKCLGNLKSMVTEAFAKAGLKP